MIRVLVVDDSAFVRQALTRMLGSVPDIEVVGTAVDGKEGWEKALDLRPDVVTLDVKMPRMDGLEALRRIMADCPTAVLLLSSQTKEGAEVTLRGLELGAMDFVDKTSVQGQMNLLSLSEELQAKVRALASVPRSRLRTVSSLVRETGPKALPAQHTARAQVVVIGTSTGGPPALQAIIPRLPEILPCAVLVVQHMPVGFTRSLAERLDARSVVEVREARQDEVVRAGSVLIAPAGLHMKLRKRGSDIRVFLDEEPRGALHRPSVDVLMASVAKAYGSRAMGVVLTGMGSDGVEGLRAIRDAGGLTLAESEETCVIYGMPKAAVEAGVVDKAVPLTRMADEILAAV
jgi:two-component system chemotaxis response regulator CheB